ncbi:MAG: hypothetical protein IPN56_15915 [Chitinophagaceae bacterium]|nr:hypothetical protein [Chitinophagaceae bacterium]
MEKLAEFIQAAPLNALRIFGLLKAKLFTAASNAITVPVVLSHVITVWFSALGKGLYVVALQNLQLQKWLLLFVP